VPASGPDAPAASQCKIAICIATCRRPDGLKALLESLDRVVVPDPAPEIGIIVVDNDPARSAAASLGDIAELTRWPLRYVTEEVPGVVASRNRLLDLVAPDVDFVAFLDDDETVSAHWLAAMLRTHERTGATVVQGPVRPVFATPTPPWTRTTRLFEVGPFRDGQRLAFAGTGNVMIRKAFLDRHALRFDMRFNRTGGEDQELFSRLQALGGTIVASADAVVFEQVPSARTTMSWVLRRSHRIGNTLGRITLIHRRGRAARIAKGFGAMLVGAATTATVGLVSSKHRMRGLAELARGSGMLMAFLGVAFVGESAQAPAPDRRER
jgi:cellulose synthase/poly-beta-1,6-N-acetylglucosamine synthase-like glycosyltransferase